MLVRNAADSTLPGQPAEISRLTSIIRSVKRIVIQLGRSALP